MLTKSSLLWILVQVLITGSQATSNKEFYDAARDGNLDLIKNELSKLTDVERCLRVNWRNNDERNRTALFIASEYGHAPVVALLIDAGADVNTADNQGVSPLMMASRFGYDGSGHLSIVEALIAAGARVGYVIPPGRFGGRTALHFAAYGNHVDKARILLANGADKTQKANNGNTPADESRLRGDGSVAMLLGN